MEEKIIDRVRKLLELGRSDNVNESAVAMAAAQKLMERHNISELMLETKAAPDEPIEDDVLNDSNGQISKWKGTLGVVLCDCNQCVCYRSGGKLRIVGKVNDAATARYLFLYIVREIERLSWREFEARGNPGRTWRNNFCLGASRTVRERLKDAAQQVRAEMRKEAYDSDTLGNGKAIVLVNNAIVKLDQRHKDVVQWTERLHLRHISSAKTRFDYDGYSAGQRAGKEIDLTDHKAVGSGSNKSLPS